MATTGGCRETGPLIGTLSEDIGPDQLLLRPNHVQIFILNATRRCKQRPLLHHKLQRADNNRKVGLDRQFEF